MKITVDLTDFWLEEESELIPSLQAHLKREVVKEIGDKVKIQVDAYMEKAMKNEVLKQLEVKVQLLMETFLETGKIKKDHYSNEFMTVEDWLSTQLKAKNEDIMKYIKQQADQQGIDLKRRYDLLFASQIVAKINEQGLLKEDVARLLLPTADK